MFCEWLVEAANQQKLDIVILALKTFDHLPMKVDTLKISGVGKVVKKLSNHTFPEIKTKATNLMKKWMEMVKRKNKKLKGTTFTIENPLKRSRETVLSTPNKKQKSIKGFFFFF